MCESVSITETSEDSLFVFQLTALCDMAVRHSVTIHVGVNLIAIWSIIIHTDLKLAE